MSATHEEASDSGSGAEPLFDVPNLDNLSIDPDDYLDCQKILTDLALYCSYKYEAMSYRLAGNVQMALHYEGHMEKLYKKLPGWARW